MCGIIGYIGKNQAQSFITTGLKKMEYRGYDSAGLSVIDKNQVINTVKVSGQVNDLIARLSKSKLRGDIGIGHTRWATHGQPNQANAHPHSSTNFTLVHNGIVENYQDIRKVLMSEEYTNFKSQTDSEVLVWLIERNYQRCKNPKRAIENSLKAVKGTFGLAILYVNQPEVLYLARRSSPLIIGHGVKEIYACSDITALPHATTRVTYLDDDQLAVATKNGVSVFDLDNIQHPPATENIQISDLESTKKGHQHFLHKEILEQPKTVAKTLRGRLNEKQSTSVIGGLDLTAEQAKKLNQIISIGCGTAYNSSLLASYLLEDITDLPLNPEVASEFLYRQRHYQAGSTLALAVSQSGETADTIAATNKMNLLGISTHGVVNVIGSNLSRITDGGTYLHCGPEISVASTKAFSSQVVAQLLIGLKLNSLRGSPLGNNTAVIKALKSLPLAIQTTLKTSEQKIKQITQDIADYDHLMFLGRNKLYPVALEGALKYKEITYIQSEAHPAGEMKHGPLALIDERMLVIFLITKDELYQKSLSNLREIEARGGNLVIITDSKQLADNYDHSILIPNSSKYISPLLFNIPLQLLAYYSALERGLNIDKPRNLAKSVTVE